jgi:hypothetical protein
LSWSGIRFPQPVCLPSPPTPMAPAAIEEQYGPAGKTMTDMIVPKGDPKALN